MFSILARYDNAAASQGHIDFVNQNQTYAQNRKRNQGCRTYQHKHNSQRRKEVAPKAASEQPD
jgi:hypothetical protein